MANRNATPNYTFEQWRVEFNNLSDDLGDFNTGIIGSVPSGTNTHVSAENAVKELIQDIDSIIDGTHQFTGDITFQSDVHVVGDFLLDGNITIGNQTTDTLTITAELDSNLIPDLDNQKDIGSSLKKWRNLYVGTEANLATAKVTNLSSGRVVLAGTDGLLSDDPDLTFSETLLTVPDLSVGTEATLASAKVSDLTFGRVVLAGNAGEIEDSANLTFDGTTLTAPDIDSTNLNVGTDATLASAVVSDLTSGRVVLAGTAGALEDSADFTYSGDTFTVTNLNVGTDATLASAKVSDLTSGRVVLAGTFGELEDNINLTFNGTTLTALNIDVVTNATLASAKVSDLTSGRVVLAGTNGELEDNANLSFDGTTLSVLGNITSSLDITSGQDLYVTRDSFLQGTTGATNTTSGALVVSGGTGIAENLYVGGNIVASGTISSGVGTFATESFSIAISVALS